MRCFSGISTSNGVVPCGQCMNCRINKGRHWTIRILLEEAGNYEKYGARSWFLTFTYDDENVPTTDEGHLTLRKKKFLKWVNHTIERVVPFRYYCVGEYGEDTFRPHYHMAVFPRRDSAIAQICDAWKHGYKSASPMVENRARYLAQYTSKKLTKADDSRLKDGMEPEFRSSSRVPPLGSSFVDKLVHQYSTVGGREVLRRFGDVERTVRLGGKVYGIPPYLLRKVRERLGIPLLHRDRLSHSGYFTQYGNVDHAEQDFEKTVIQNRKRRNEQKIKRSITHTV